MALQVLEQYLAQPRSLSAVRATNLRVQLSQVYSAVDVNLILTTIYQY